MILGRIKAIQKVEMKRVLRLAALLAGIALVLLWLVEFIEFTNFLHSGGLHWSFDIFRENPVMGTRWGLWLSGAGILISGAIISFFGEQRGGAKSN